MGVPSFMATTVWLFDKETAAFKETLCSLEYQVCSLGSFGALRLYLKAEQGPTLRKKEAPELKKNTSACILFACQNRQQSQGSGGSWLPSS